MAWIESNQELGRHPKTKKLARLLDISIVAVVGHLHYLWWWALDFAQDGLLSKFDEFDISEACMWEGDEKKFVDTLIQVGFIDETEDCLVIHDWMDYAGRLVAQREHRREQTRQRVQNHRKKADEKCNDDVMRYKSDSNDDVTQGNAPTVPNQTNITTTTTAREEILAELSEAEILPDNTAAMNDILNSANDNTKNMNKSSESVNESLPLGINVVKWAQANWGRPLSPLESETIMGWCDTFSTEGSSEANLVVIEALRECNNAGPDARNMNYLKTIMVNWLEAGVINVAQVEARRDARKKQQDKPRNKGRPERKTSPEKYEGFYL